MTSLSKMGRLAREAAFILSTLSTEEKNNALEMIAVHLERNKDAILERNEKDIEAGKLKGLSAALLDRLLLTEKRIQGLVTDTRNVIKLEDPVGKEIDRRMMDNGMTLIRRRVPIGVLGVIYEARPNVTVDIATLSLKTGNSVILRGGSETINSNRILAEIISDALESAGLPEKAVQYIDDPDRSHVQKLLRLDKYVDMIIPRGGQRLHDLCREQATIPVITGGIGICHIFLDESGDRVSALDIVENAKVQRPSVCNALDTLLVHEKVAERFLPAISKRLAMSNVVLKANDEALAILMAAEDGCEVQEAGADDFDKEWLGLTLGVKIVADVDEAIRHIRDHSTEHSDSILTEDEGNADRFVDQVNSAAVYVNASTRFTDGSQFGLGAEVAVSTQKLHARGPMGLEELTTYKWIGRGTGQIRK